MPDVAELVEALSRQVKGKRQPGDLDAYLLVERNGFTTRNMSNAFLNKLERDGLVTRLKIFENGRWRTIFRPVAQRGNDT
jgi:hypothetical protein